MYWSHLIYHQKDKNIASWKLYACCNLKLQEETFDIWKDADVRMFLALTSKDVEEESSQINEENLTKKEIQALQDLL